MERNGRITGVLLLAAFAAVGCSKGSDAPPQQSRDATQTRPTAPQAAVAPADEEGFGEGVVPAAGPVSFADAESAYHAGDYSKASMLFARYTEQRPENAWGHFMLGLSTWKSGDLSTAEGAFEKALSIDPDHVKSLVNLSRVLIDQKRFDDALDRLMRAGDIEPTSTDVHRLLGRAFHGQGQVTDAIDAYRRAIELDDKDAWSMNNLGLLLIEQRRADEAVPLLARAIELKEEVPAFHNNLGMALEHTGRFAAAAAAYQGALSADPGYAKAKQNLARVEAVKSAREEPIDLAAAAQSVANSAISTDEDTAGR